ncbi:MAG: GNAT family N-acetyltransferase [Rhodospirillales bacterium]|nr:GNAT family N-acetyltransferase [Rhodospirillales bacterium]
MPDGREPIAVKVVSKIADIPAEQWDACAGTINPFVSHAFLLALESSGTVKAETGWQPQHLSIENKDGEVVACAPLYLKSHSYGEYVFDWAWANAYHRAGGKYYPKLQNAVPFSPVPGPRFLVNPEENQAELTQALMEALAQLTKQHHLSSAHVTFCQKEEWEKLGEKGYLLRTGHQFHWSNDGYKTFDDFLAALSSRKRKTIKKERRGIQKHDVDLKTITGTDITESHWDALYTFYLDTAARKWGEPYLNREFFTLLGETMADKVVLFMAENNGVPTAAAFNILGEDTLYGRYWGCIEDYKFLHFEACYYRAIDFAIEHGLAKVEAGAQGSHKVQRGYLPTKTYSAHWIPDQKFREAVDHFLLHERRDTDNEIKAYMGYSPFKSET